MFKLFVVVFAFIAFANNISAMAEQKTLTHLEARNIAEQAIKKRFGSEFFIDDKYTTEEGNVWIFYPTNTNSEDINKRTPGLGAMLVDKISSQTCLTGSILITTFMERYRKSGCPNP